MINTELFGWDRLRHGGLLLDTPRLRQVAELVPEPLPFYFESKLRRQSDAVIDGSTDVSAFVTFVLEEICGFSADTGTWYRGTQVGAEWTRRSVTGEAVKPRQLWCGNSGGQLPVFIDTEKRVGVGRGRKTVSQVLQWMRAGEERMAVITNGRQWRLLFAGLDFDAWCEWDVDLWFEEGKVSSQVEALRTLLSPTTWTLPSPETQSPLLRAILDSRKGQAELSAVLGERVREAVEILLQAHGEVLKERCVDVSPADVYRAAVRVVMRLVVVLFAESRELLPRDRALYHGAYGLSGLLESLEKVAARGGNRLASSCNAWPRVLGLFRLVFHGSHHPDLTVPEYGGELFALGDTESMDGVSKSLAVFESACFDRELMFDWDVFRLLERITRTRVKVRQSRSSTWVPVPVDFSDLSSEYIGILYEGLLDFELKTAPAGDPVAFLAIGNQPALPLSRLEAMDDKALSKLLEKMKDTSSGEVEGEAGETEESLESDEAADADEVDEFDDDFEGEAVEEGDTSTEDERYTTRTRAEKWARRAVEVGKLAKKPRGKMTPEKRLVYEETVAVKARRLVTRVVLPGEWYLVRWGGTRKGAGTFYTRPGLAVPTVQRTLRPIAFDPPVDSAGQPDLEAPAGTWTPKKPEEILALKVCDPACGSGTFPVAALRFLTDALYTSLHHYQRIREHGDRAMVALLTGIEGTEERLAHEFIPCRPDDALFEPRLKAVLRRHVVERCLYGVDLDPLAVELCRLSLWIETMDRDLPFSFLDHKIKCGNSLVGAWFDQFQHYPVMAWKNREGGDKNHTNGVHFKKEARTKAIKAFVKEQLTPDLKVFLSGPTLFHEDLQEQAIAVHSEALSVLLQLHELSVQDSEERARIYQEELVGSKTYGALRAAMDLWCACWFWPADELDHAPLPTTFAAPPAEISSVAERVAAVKRFFHWELEFPDVFRSPGSGFDAILGNPPWETLQPNSKEFFSNADPLYRSYGKQEALRYQTNYFVEERIELVWLDYNAGFANYSNWMKYVGSPFGDPEENEKSSDRFSIVRGKANTELHAHWRSKRTNSSGFAIPEHPFRHRGEGKAYTYKMFLEQTYSLLREGGRLGFIVPSGLYSDDGTGALRKLLLDRCRWEWCFNFENREAIFDIHRSFKFNPIVVERGPNTEAIKFAANRRKVEDWAVAEKCSVVQTRRQITNFSPKANALVEVTSDLDLKLLERIYRQSILLGDSDSDFWGISYRQGDFNLSSKSKLFESATRWFRNRAKIDEAGRWCLGGDQAFPLYEGKMIWQYDFSFSSYDFSSRRWIEKEWQGKQLIPRYLIPMQEYAGTTGIKLIIRDVSSPSNRRTLIAACVPDFPGSHKTPILRGPEDDWRTSLAILTTLNSLAFDYFLRLRFAPSGGGGSLTWSILSEQPLWRPEALPTCLIRLLSDIALQLLGDWYLFTPVVATRLSEENTEFLRPAIDPCRRLELRCVSDALNLFAYGFTLDEAKRILRDCDHPLEQIQSKNFQRTIETKLFWRVDKEKHPELRHTVLSLVAFCDLTQRISESDEVNGALVEFASGGEKAWHLPESIILSDYGLGHDVRADRPQLVRDSFECGSDLGPPCSGSWEAFARNTANSLYGKGWTLPHQPEPNLTREVTDNSIPAQMTLFDESGSLSSQLKAKRRH